jgi:lipopolysaccharide transport system permease protein
MSIKIIKSQKSIKDYFTEIISSTELIKSFVIKDLSVKYRNTAIGLIWIILKSIVASTILIFIFSRVVENSIENDTSYIAFVYSGVCCWFFFQTSLSESTNSLISNQGLFSKIYIPKLVFVISILISCFIDFLVSLLILGAILIFFQIKLSSNFLFFPFGILLLIYTTFIYSFVSSLIAVKYRDFKHLVPFLLQVGLYLSPIAINMNDLSPRMQLIFFLNPITVSLSIIRFSIFGISLNSHIILLSLGSFLLTSLVLFFATKYFLRLDKNIVDII